MLLQLQFSFPTPCSRSILIFLPWPIYFPIPAPLLRYILVSYYDLLVYQFSIHVFILSGFPTPFFSSYFKVPILNIYHDAWDSETLFQVV